MGFSFGGPVADEGGVDFCAQNISLMFLSLISSHTVTVQCICVGFLVMGYVQCIFPRLYFKKEVGNETLLVPVNGNQNRKIHKNSNLSLHCISVKNNMKKFCHRF